VSEAVRDRHLDDTAASEPGHAAVDGCAVAKVAELLVMNVMMRSFA
jgi:hypothetical protein